MDPQLVPLGAVVLGNESVAPVGLIDLSWVACWLPVCAAQKYHRFGDFKLHTHQFSTVLKARDLKSLPPGSSRDVGLPHPLPGSRGQSAPCLLQFVMQLKTLG